jgi:CcmD family protein
MHSAQCVVVGFYLAVCIKNYELEARMSPEMQNIVSYLIPAYVIFWLVTFLYVFSIRSRQKNLEKDIEVLKLLAEKKKGNK